MSKKERRDNSKLRELMDEYGVKTMEDVHNFVKMLTVNGSDKMNKRGN